ncbi:MAG TPA: hypothetical protein VHQ00_00790 [Chloroflexota bacterium]|nr:hypothetical protein [Chloroflexota bacterium]
MSQTEVAIEGQRFLLNGRPTYAGRTWRGHPVEGLLMNSRMVQATFDDENPLTAPMWAYPDTGRWDAARNCAEFVAMLPRYRAHGLLAVTLNLQGGCPTGYFRAERLDEILAPLSPESREAAKAQLRGPLEHAQPWHNSALDAGGELKESYLGRLETILGALDRLGMVAILGVYYFGQDERLRDEAAVRRGLQNTVQWVLRRGFTNVLLEVNNETNVRRYEHEILQPHRVHELIREAKEITHAGRRLLVGTSYGGRKVPEENVAGASDFLLLHGNGVTDPAKIGEMVAQTRALEAYRARPLPIVFNEDDHFAFDQPRNNLTTAVESYASWGYFDGGASSGGGVALGNYADGYQLVPVNWGINTPVKEGFFCLLGEITGAPEAQEAPSAPEGAPDGAPSDDPQTLQREAEEQVRRNSRTLRAHPLPPAAEPSFYFRP